jgi:glycosyltransferase involved in cell wall biosynthesis
MYVFSCGGRHTKRKGIQDLLVALNFVDSSLNYKLRIFGKGPLTGYYKELIDRFELDNTVELIGFVDDVRKELHDADVFILPSHAEGLPTVLIEAMSEGCKLVATDCKFGPREILDNGKLGTLVKPKDPIDLAEGIEQEISENRHDVDVQYMLDNFSIEFQSQEYLKLMRD